MVSLRFRRVQAIKVIRAQIGEGDLLTEDVVGNDQEAVSERERGAFRPSAPTNPSILRTQMGAVRSSGCPRGFDQGCAELLIAQASGRWSPFPGALVRAWADPRPRGKVRAGGESRHVHPNLGHDDFGGPPTDTRDRLKRFKVGVQRTRELDNPRVALRDQCRSVIELRQ